MGMDGENPMLAFDFALQIIKMYGKCSEKDLEFKLDLIDNLMKCIKDSVNEAAFKEFLKFFKANSTDKLEEIRVACFKGVTKLMKGVAFPMLISDAESIAFHFLKCSADSEAAIVISSLVCLGLKGLLLQKKTDEQAENSTLIWSPEKCFSFISNLFSKSSSKSFVFQVYQTFLRNSDDFWLASNLDCIQAHLLGIIKHGIEAKDVLLCLFHKLNEGAECRFIEIILEEKLSKYPSTLDSTEPSELEITCILSVFHEILKQISPVLSAELKSSIVEKWKLLVDHPSKSVHALLSSCMKEFCQHNKECIKELLVWNLSILKKDYGLYHPENNKLQLKLSCLSLCLSAVIGSLGEAPLYICFEDLEATFHWSLSLLRQPDCSSDAQRMAWQVISGHCLVGRGFIRPFISQMMLLWSSCLSKINKPQENDELFWISLLKPRSAALASLHSFLSNELDEHFTSNDLAKRILKFLDNSFLLMSHVPLKLKHLLLDYKRQLFYCFYMIKADSFVFLHSLLQQELYEVIFNASCPDDLLLISMKLFSKLFVCYSINQKVLALEQILKSKEALKLTLKNNPKAPNNEMSILKCFQMLIKELFNKSTVSKENQEKLLVISQEILQGYLTDPRIKVRYSCAKTLGKLTKIVNNTDFNKQLVESLVEQIINNKDAEERCGYILTLGLIFKLMGGLTASSTGNILNAVVGILLSCSADSNLYVQNCALMALGFTIEACGLLYVEFCSSTLSGILKILLGDKGNRYVGNDSTFLKDLNMRSPLAMRKLCGRVVSNLINVMGPEVCKYFAELTPLCLYFEKEDGCLKEAVSGYQQIILFSSFSKISFSTLLNKMRAIIMNKNSKQAHSAAITCLRQGIMKAEQINENIDDLQEQLFFMFDNEGEDESMKREISDLLKLLCAKNEKSLSILSRLVTGKQEVTEEASKHTEVKWSTKVLSLEILQSMRFNSNQVDKVIEIAFCACSPLQYPLQMQGVLLMGQLINSFKDERDPQFPDVPLLEPYQAQIMSSLVPVLESKKHADLMSQGIEKMSLFYIHCLMRQRDKKTSRAHRILSVLLEKVKKGERLTCEETSSVQAETLMQLSVLEAWSRIHLSEKLQDSSELMEMWKAALSDYTRILVDDHGLWLFESPSSPTGKGGLMNTSRDILEQVPC